MIYLLDEIPSINNEKLVETKYPKLSKNRLEKVLRYKNKIDRWFCCIAYLLTAYGVNREFNISITALENLIYNKYGKPHFEEFSNVFFNISHCVLGVAVIISDEEVGIDIQDITKYEKDMAVNVFSNNEIEDIENSCEKDVLFTRYWTLKESFIKNRGIGISEELKKIDFSDCKADEFIKDKFCYKTFYQNKFIISACGPLKTMKIEKIALSELLTAV